MKRGQVFVSYSHEDSEHLARLKVHLRPFERKGLVEVWSDAKLKAGQRWRKQIEDAINRAAVAILLVSADFLASDFVVDNELPPLLKAAQEEGVKVLPVILKPCAFSDIEEIAQFQSFNDPKHSLISLDEAQREQLWYEVASAVGKELSSVAATDTPQPKIEAVRQRDEAGVDIEDQWAFYGTFGEELHNPAAVDDFYVYSYHHVDELAHMPRAEEVLGNVDGFAEAFERIKERLKVAGWEGDGEIRLMWIPPFVGAGVEDTWGVGVWFVKQSNNGTAWMASPVPLPFPRLLEQNAGHSR